MPLGPARPLSFEKRHFAIDRLPCASDRGPFILFISRVVIRVAQHMVLMRLVQPTATHVHRCLCGPPVVSRGPPVALSETIARGGLDTLTRQVEGSLLRHDRILRRQHRPSDHALQVPVDATILSSILEEIALHDFEPLLHALPQNHPDLRCFVRRISSMAATNPLLCEFADGLRSSASPIEPVEDEELYRLMHYCLLLDAVTRAIASDPKLAALVYARLREVVRSTPGWWRPLGLFELAKLLTVEMTLERFIEHRRDRNLPDNFGHIGLPFNILEAVLQDMRLGFMTNAVAGLTLCVARPGQPAGRRRGQGASLSSDSRRAVRMHLPREREWRDLYVSWNLAFTTAYADVPTRFGAPLLAPCVLGAPPDEFMFYRVLALHTHICLFIRRRASQSHASAATLTLPAFLTPAVSLSGAPASNAWRLAMSGEPTNAVALSANDRRRRFLTELWGTINLEAAQRYERRLRLAPFVTAAKLTFRSAFASRRVPYPASLILPPPRTAGYQSLGTAKSARARANRVSRPTAEVVR